MNERIKRNTPALVEETLANYGAWDAVSFLLIGHRLRQTGYEAWRMGDVAYLEDTIAGNTARIVEMLEAALLHAKSMGLISAPATWSGWGKQSGQILNLFHDDDLNSIFLVRLSPKADRPQLDLFMDAPHIILLNRLRQALLNRSPECNALFDRALDEIANEPALARLDTIRAAMTTPSIENPVVWFAYLNDVIAPAVRDEFSQHSMDIMAPLWRDAADAMAHIPFDPDHPNNHASQAFLLANAWEQCLASVEQTADWFEHSNMHDRRIAALSAMHEQKAEKAAWILYCWCCPDAAVSALDSADLHACGLHALWQRFSQLETDQSIEYFPALIALKHRLNNDQTPTFEQARHTNGWQYYQQIIDLQASEQHGETDITRRSTLKASSPWLFQAYMAARG
jgi:hypothetical protein